MNALNGMRVAILEARMKDEMANLIRRHGGEPYSVPSVREMIVPSAEEVSRFIDRLSQKFFDTIVFQTGVGVKALLKEAERQGRLSTLVNDIQNVTTVCRGPKPTSALRKEGLPVSVSVESPYTTHELKEALAENGLKGKWIAVFHYGERNQALTDFLIDEGALVDDFCLYEWMLPEDLAPMNELITELLDGKVDVTVFTSQVQVRHLFRVATMRGLSPLRLSDALNSGSIVAAVGPTCANALRDFDVIPDVVPDHPKMGHMIKDLSEHVLGNAVKPIVKAS